MEIHFAYCNHPRPKNSGILMRRRIQKFPDCVDNEINAYNNKHSLKRNTKGYGDKTH
jgi:hypothetical protein